ncbi:cysteine desulfurase family protein [Corynebacterium otitidis]|uniref:cysteine desulfurase family protein n=1 Tax=Corynebacterium otitidis TaxID=29321 RepID=UPI0006275F3D|nr:cysteine desulfurase family protein [Corynebacterium otitidis]KKO84420.1 cysteine desulfurase [Corynebacterium otitidis]
MTTANTTTSGERFYFDHAATSPMRESAIEAWVRHARDLNPGGQYGSGRAAQGVLDDAREEIASLVGAEPTEVIFTASGTEADNIALQGLFASSQAAGGQGRNRVVVSSVEHPAIKEPARLLESRGAALEVVPVDETGHVTDLSALDEPAGVAALMVANNETGAIQPAREFAARAAKAGTPVHLDAVQATGRIPVDFHELGATTLAASAHKFGGPRGIGFLLARRSPAPTPILVGGGQERGIRPGTADVASAAAMAAALKEAVGEMAGERTRVAALRDRLKAGILERIDDVVVNTAEPAMPGHLSVSFPGAEGDSLIMLLDTLGVEAATGSACGNGVNRASDVLLAMGVEERTARGTVRFTLGPRSTDQGVDFLIDRLPEVVSRARAAGMA